MFLLWLILGVKTGGDAVILRILGLLVLLAEHKYRYAKFCSNSVAQEQLFDADEDLYPRSCFAKGWYRIVSEITCYIYNADWDVLSALN